MATRKTTTGARTASRESRSRRREARREEMVAAAMKLFGEGGLERLTIQTLAAELGCAVGALYRYFPGKAALLVALQEQAIASLSAEIAAEIGASRVRVAKAGLRDAEVTALAHVLAAVRPVVESWKRDPARHRLVDDLLSAPAPVLPDVDLARVNAALAPLLDQVAALFHEAELAGALRPGDAAMRTRLAWAALHGLEHFRKRDRAEPAHLRVGVLMAELLRTLLVGWGARPGAIDAALAIGSNAGGRAKAPPLRTDG